MVLSLLGVQPRVTNFRDESFSLIGINEFLATHSLEEITKPFWLQNLDLLETSQIKLKGKNELRATLKKILFGFGQKIVIRNVLNDSVSKWRRIEILFGLQPDSLQCIKKAVRSYRGKPYRDFIKKQGHLQ